MTGVFAGRDGHDVDALVTDRYLDALLAAHAHGGERSPAASESSPAGSESSPAGSELEQRLRRTADRLDRDLPRLHPSFRFEEALAARLADVAARMRLPTTDVAARMRLPTTVGAAGVVVPIAGRASEPRAGGRDDADLRGAAGSRDPRATSRRPRVAYGRPLLIGGALTSAALSLAGAAYVAWRLNRPAVGPMARAVRAVARTRLA